MIVVVLALAGAIGAVARFVVDGYVQGRLGSVFPWGTFVINTSGSVLLGFLAGVALNRGFPHLPYAFLATGFCGAYTTFSTFGYETIRLAEEGAGQAAGAFALGSVVAGLVGAVLGLSLAAAF